MRLIQISNFKLGQSVHGFYLCKEKHIRHTRSGNSFLDMVFSDATGVIDGKLWDMADHFNERFQSGDPVAVKGKVTVYKEKLQITVTNINLANNQKYGKYGFDPDKIIRTVDEPLDVLWKKIMIDLNTLDNPYKKLIWSIYRNYEEKIRNLPSSIYHHQPIRGGFLKSLVTTTEMSMDILPYYPSLDKNLVISGILLLNIGMIKSINDEMQPKYTEAGKMLGQAALGLEILKEAVLLIKNFPEDLLLKLEHIIFSGKGRNGEKSWQVPRFPEALFVHHMAELDEGLILMRDDIYKDLNIELIDNSKRNNPKKQIIS